MSRRLEQVSPEAVDSNASDVTTTQTKPTTPDAQEILIKDLFQQAGISMELTQTKGDWCLFEGMNHILAANDGALTSIIKEAGVPQLYNDSIAASSSNSNCRHENNNSTDDDTADQLQQYYKPQNCFQSLCRIITGQQLAGPAAMKIWQRFVSTTNNNVTPSKILELSERGLEEYLQKPSGLSKAKAKSIVALSDAFESNTLTETLYSDSSSSSNNNDCDDEVRKALLKIPGIGPWTCDMFFMFYLERSDVFPIGDLGVRKGMAKLFSLRGSGRNGSLCPQKDLDKMEEVMKPYQPYRSIATYYMWKIVDIGKDTKESNSTTTSNKHKAEAKPVGATKKRRKAESNSTMTLRKRVVK